MSMESTSVLPTHQEAVRISFHSTLTPEKPIEIIANPLKAELKASAVTGWTLRGIGVGLVVYGFYQLAQEHYVTAAICIFGGYLLYKKGSQLIKGK